MATATATATATAREVELKTYWCHECDMSVALSSPSPLLCPHCHTHFLELMDSPFAQNDVESSLPSTSPLFDVVFQDALSLLSPPPPLTPKPKPLPVILVTDTLLSELDLNGVVLCAVCKDEIAVDAEANQLPCKHLYHSDCISPWLELHASCPLCRFRLPEEEEEEEEDDGDFNGGASARDREIRMQLIARLSELNEDDFFGLSVTLNHIASRNESRARMNEQTSVGGGDEELM